MATRPNVNTFSTQPSHSIATAHNGQAEFQNGIGRIHFLSWKCGPSNSISEKNTGHGEKTTGHGQLVKHNGCFCKTSGI